MKQVTVIGEAKTQQKNQVATYNAGVNITGVKKETVVAEANKKIGDLIKALKDFGIPQADIQTQSMTLNEEEIYPTKNKQWRAYNAIEIKLRDTTKAGELTDLLNKSGANNVYGPSYAFEDTNEAGKTLYDAAIKDAREKAEMIAKASGRKLGKVINVIDGGSNNTYPIYGMMDSAKGGVGLGEGAVVEPGSTTVSKSMTVVFEMK